MFEVERNKNHSYESLLCIYNDKQILHESIAQSFTKQKVENPKITIYIQIILGWKGLLYLSKHMEANANILQRTTFSKMSKNSSGKF